MDIISKVKLVSLWVVLITILFLIVIRIILPSATLFHVVADTEFIEARIGSEGSTISVNKANICVYDRANLITNNSACGIYHFSPIEKFNGRISIPANVYLRLRLDSNGLIQIQLNKDTGENSIGLRLQRQKDSKIQYVELPARVDIPLNSNRQFSLTFSGYDAKIGSLPNRDTSGSRNALISGKVNLYGPSIQFPFVEKSVDPLQAQNLYDAGSYQLELGDLFETNWNRRFGSKIAEAFNVRPQANSIEAGSPYWATVGANASNALRINLRSVADEGAIVRYGGSGLNLAPAWFSPIAYDPTIQVLWSFLAALIGLGGFWKLFFSNNDKNKSISKKNKQ